MVYCMDVTVDSADELPEGICRGARLSSVDFGPDLPKLCQTTSVHLGKSEEPVFSRHSVARKKRRAHRGQSSPSTSPFAGIRWSLGSSNSGSVTSRSQPNDLERSYSCDLDDAGFDVEESVPGTNEAIANMHSSVPSSVPATSGVMFQNGIYNLHNDAFGMAIGDGMHNVDDWGPYPYFVMSQIALKPGSIHLEQLLR